MASETEMYIRRLALTMEHFYFKVKKEGECIKRQFPLFFDIPEYYGFRKL
jgi:hypothetical protein